VFQVGKIHNFLLTKYLKNSKKKLALSNVMNDNIIKDWKNPVGKGLLENPEVLYYLRKYFQSPAIYIAISIFS